MFLKKRAVPDVYMCAHVCLWVCICACVKVRCLHWVSFFFFLRQGISLNLKLIASVGLGWPVSSRDLSVSLSPVLGLQACCHNYTYWMWVLGTEPRPSFCITSTLLTEPSPRPRHDDFEKLFILFVICVQCL